MKLLERLPFESNLAPGESNLAPTESIRPQMWFISGPEAPMVSDMLKTLRTGPLQSRAKFAADQDTARADKYRLDQDPARAGSDALGDRLRAVADEVGSVMLVGHNPGLQQLAPGPGPPHGRRARARGEVSD